MFTRFKILPIVIILAAAGLVFKVDSISNGVDSLIRQASAQEAEDTIASDDGEDAVNVPTPAEETDPLLMSRSELDLLQDLAVRREALNARERELSMRERLLEATEIQIDGKIAQLQNLEGRISILVQSYEDQENEEMNSLVKIYETMKPKDAAAIFVLLDMTVQLEVAQRMKESKMAPILANMPPESARELTTQLASRANLPQIDG
jgi:flagellar motility protein MotE (MotC chaperone)